MLDAYAVCGDARAGGASTRTKTRRTPLLTAACSTATVAPTCHRLRVLQKYLGEFDELGSGEIDEIKIPVVDRLVRSVALDAFRGDAEVGQ
jgi:hypothetical protein